MEPLRARAQHIFLKTNFIQEIIYAFKKMRVKFKEFKNLTLYVNDLRQLNLTNWIFLFTVLLIVYKQVTRHV